MDSLEKGSAEWREAHRIVAERIGWTLGADEDPMIGLPQIAALAGVAEGTPTQWRARTRRGELTGDRAFPDPDDPRHEDKPLWHAIATIIPWLQRTRRWPPGSAGRPESRGPRPSEGVKPGARYVPA
jgi:hypothetical protein